MPDKNTNPLPFRFQRAISGLLALAFLIIGGLLYLEGNPDRVFICGMFIRVGLLLAAIWIAWPQIIGRPKRFSPLAVGIVLAGLFLAASRPRLVPIIFAVLVVAFFANAIIRRFTNKRVR